MNRDFKRFARMTRRAIPSDDELRHNLHRRMRALARRDDSTGQCNVQPVLSGSFLKKTALL